MNHNKLPTRKQNEVVNVTSAFVKLISGKCLFVRIEYFAPLQITRFLFSEAGVDCLSVRCLILSMKFFRISLILICQSVPIRYIVGGFYISRTWKMSPYVHIYRRCMGFVALGVVCSYDGTCPVDKCSMVFAFYCMYIHDILWPPLWKPIAIDSYFSYIASCIVVQS